MSAPSRSRVGILPAAGRALRLGPRARSKEVEPVGGRPVATFALKAFQAAGATHTWLVTRPGKWDLLDGLEGWSLGVVWVPPTLDLPDTLARALPLARGAEILLGLPDIAFAPTDLFARAGELRRVSGADLGLVLVPARRPERSDTVAIDDGGRVEEIAVRDARSSRPWVWIGAVWSERFESFLAGWTRSTARASERHLGEAFAAALAGGLSVVGSAAPDARWLDIGTPEDLARSRGWPEVDPPGDNTGT